jgi:HNH endonuclease
MGLHLSTEHLDCASQDEIKRLKSHVQISSAGCWEWTASRTPLGYGQVYFRGRRRLAHRASWVVHRGEIPIDSTKYGTANVLHRCDNPCCINPDHLFLGNQADNANDAISKGRWGKRGCKGEKHGRARLTEGDVMLIRASEKSTRELAVEFAVSQSTIAHIVKGRTWGHLKGVS